MGAADEHSSRRCTQQQKMRTAPASRSETLLVQARQAGDARRLQAFLCEFKSSHVAHVCAGRTSGIGRAIADAAFPATPLVGYHQAAADHKL